MSLLLSIRQAIRGIGYRQLFSTLAGTWIACLPS